jgi:hypothetical protein
MKLDSNLKKIAQDIMSGMSDSELADKWDYPSVEMFRLEKQGLIALGLLDPSYTLDGERPGKDPDHDS